MVLLSYITAHSNENPIKSNQHKKDHSCCKKDTTNNKSNKQDIPKFQ